MNKACLKSIALVYGIACHWFRRIRKVFPFLLRLKAKKQHRCVSNIRTAARLTGLRKREQAGTCRCAFTRTMCVETAEDCNVI